MAGDGSTDSGKAVTRVDWRFGRRNGMFKSRFYTLLLSTGQGCDSDDLKLAGADGRGGLEARESGSSGAGFTGCR